ncbi:MAG: methyltransferase domain-containing protein [Alphaproteobacteria bacterium]|nr:methyltransferase domain-containing protein [Alphaproteobacteria bacterium]
MSLAGLATATAAASAPAAPGAAPSTANLPPRLAAAWSDWLAVAGERVHIGYEITDPDLARHTAICNEAADATVARLAALWPHDAPPARILDIGSSAGFKALALQRRFPAAEVAGIDPDDAAIRLGRAIIAEAPIAPAAPRPALEIGVAEALPWPDGHFDLVICLTTLEHVGDVERSIAEMARVLHPGGVALIEAPNYLWPYEPHLGILVPPLCPKPLMRLCARMQGQGALAWYVGHLQLVHPRRVERQFRACGLACDNLAAGKIMAVAAGDAAAVKAYGRAARILGTLGRVGLARPLARLLVALGLYPSLLYRAEKR